MIRASIKHRGDGRSRASVVGRMGAFVSASDRWHIGRDAYDISATNMFEKSVTESPPYCRSIRS